MNLVIGWAVGLLAAIVGTACAQSNAVSLSPADWEATDSLRAETHLGRPSLYLNRGVALARNLALENGMLEYDVAATRASNFLGFAFRSKTPRFTEVLFLRPGQSRTAEALQYAPAFNSLGAAWQVYHGAGANAAVAVPREQWIHVRIELDGVTARVFCDTSKAPVLVVPRLAGSGGTRFGLWGGAYGRGAYYSNLRFAPSSASAAAAAPQAAPGTITHWQLSAIVEPERFTPRTLPDLSRLAWENVSTEPEGFVLVNRFREQPNVSPPVDPKTREVLVDSVMTGRIAGSRIVYGRATVNASRDGLRRLFFTYSDGIVLYVNGRPIAFAMNPQYFRDALGVMARSGDAVYVPLKRGRNEIVVASIELGGGWAFGVRLDPALD